MSQRVKGCYSSTSILVVEGRLCFLTTSYTPGPFLISSMKTRLFRGRNDFGQSKGEGRGGREGLSRKPSASLHPSQIQLSGCPETSFFPPFDLSSGPSRSRSRGRLRVCGCNPSRPTISAFALLHAFYPTFSCVSAGLFETTNTFPHGFRSKRGVNCDGGGYFSTP